MACDPQSESPRLLGLVTARGGSKRLPGKNIRMLGDRPLIAWTLDAARASGVLCDVLVSTDDPAIAETAQVWGGLVPWLRPAELAGDSASSIDVALHALDWYEAEHGRVDGLLLLQPTSPFRRAETLREAVDLFRKGSGRPVVSVSPAEPPPAWCFTLANGALTPLLGWEMMERRSQDLEPTFALNGAVFLATPAVLRERRTYVTEDTLPLLMSDPAEALDIDTEWDWILAKAILARLDKA